jgi:hypothetical protein
LLEFVDATDELGHDTAFLLPLIEKKRNFLGILIDSGFAGLDRLLVPIAVIFFLDVLSL